MTEKDKISTTQEDKINLNDSHVNERPVQKDKVSTKSEHKKHEVDTDQQTEEEEEEDFCE